MELHALGCSGQNTTIQRFAIAICKYRGSGRLRNCYQYKRAKKPSKAASRLEETKHSAPQENASTHRYKRLLNNARNENA